MAMAMEHLLSVIDLSSQATHLAPISLFLNSDAVKLCYSCYRLHSRFSSSYLK
jgi:hypothetical protein